MKVWKWILLVVLVPVVVLLCFFMAQGASFLFTHGASMQADIIYLGVVVSLLYLTIWVMDFIVNKG